MRRLSTIVFFTASLLAHYGYARSNLLWSPAPATIPAWYVDNTVSSSGDGTSWATAWKDFSNIVWASIQPGDTIYISGGSSSQTYSVGKLTLGASGGTGNPFTITKGVEAGHNGTVILDGTNYDVSGGTGIIDTNSKTNFVLQNLTVQNTLERCIYLHGVTTGAVTIQNMAVHTGTAIQQQVATNATTATSSAVLHFASGSIPNFASYATNQVGVEDLTNQAAILKNGNNFIISSTSTSLTMQENASATVGSGDIIAIGVTGGRGFDVRSNTGGTITIANNTVDTPALSPSQTDTWFSTGNTATILASGNSFIVNNADGAQHSDSIQSVADNNITWKGNFISHPNGGFNNHGMVIDSITNGGTLFVYNNAVIMGGGSLADTAILRENLSSTTGIVKIWNNSMWVQWAGITYGGTTPATDEFKNNIIDMPASSETGGSPYILSSGNLSPVTIIDYNVVRNLLSTTIGNVSGVGNRTYAQWQTAGYDAHGANGNPLFVNSTPTVATDMELTGGSPAINTGLTIATVTTDYLGVARPVGSAYDIGAFEQ